LSIRLPMKARMICRSDIMQPFEKARKPCFLGARAYPCEGEASGEESEGKPGMNRTSCSPFGLGRGHISTPLFGKGKKSTRSISRPEEIATASTSGLLSSGIDPRSFQLCTVDTGRLIARAIGRTPPNASMILITYVMGGMSAICDHYSIAICGQTKNSIRGS
jgi:hypothetical protein